jgi:ATP-dependent exoDNAse (exonuclease V) beta subunit
MTIHKAKGLEFDCVFLPGLSRATRSNSKDLLMWREYLSEQHSGLIMAPLSATGEKEGETYKHLYYEQAIASALENTRLLYVACTRAISQLELTFTFDDDSKSPQNNTLLHTIWPTVKESIQWHSSSGRGTGQLGLDFDTSLQQSAKLQRISTSWQPPGWSFPNPLSAYYLQAEYSEEQNQPLIINNLPKRVFGTVIHSILERLVTTGIEFWLKLHSEQRVTWITRLLQANGLYQDGLQEYATEVIRHINNTVTDSKGSWILSREHAYSQCELALLGIKNGEIKRKTIDRCFIDKAGDLWIIDYKSAQPQTDEPDKDFIDRECIEYRMQLNSYKTFINNYAGVNPYNQIRMAIYFTHFPFFQEVN